MTLFGRATAGWTAHRSSSELAQRTDRHYGLAGGGDRTPGRRRPRNRFAEQEDIETETPDLVVLATGGLPIKDLPEGEGPDADNLEVLGRPDRRGRIVFYDQTSGKSAMSTAQYLTEKGTGLSFATPDRLPGYDIGAQNLPVFMRLLNAGTQFLADAFLLGVRREGNGLAAAAATATARPSRSPPMPWFSTRGWRRTRSLRWPDAELLERGETRSRRARRRPAAARKERRGGSISTVPR